jgi:hypothetical protein
MGVVGFALIAKGSKSQSDERALPVFLIAGAILAVTACFSYLLIYLSQPAVYQNPGLAVYTPPPNIPPVPIPRKSDAPKLADRPDTPSPVTALAQAQTDDKKLKGARAPVRNRPRVVPQENDRRTLDYARQWNYGHFDWNSSHARSGVPKLTGGPKSWF